MTSVRLSGLLLLGLLQLGCNRGEGLAATEVLNEANCSGADAGMRKVDYAAVAALRGKTLLSMTEPAPTPGSEELHLLAISKGRQATPGYRFELEDARLIDGEAVLEIRWHSPDPDNAQAQVVTFPCLVVGLEPGPFTTIRAEDQDGALLGELKI